MCNAIHVHFMFKNRCLAYVCILSPVKIIHPTKQNLEVIPYVSALTLITDRHFYITAINAGA